MNKRITVLLLSIMLLISCAACFTGCNKKANSPGNAIPEDIDGPAKFTVTALSVSDKINISYTLELEPGAEGGNVAVTAKPQRGKTVKATLSPDGNAEIDCPDRAGVMTLTLTYTDKNGKELTKAELKIKDGLIQLTPDGILPVVAAMTDEEKAQLITGVSEPLKPGASGGTYAIERLGIPSITVNDGPAGMRYGTTVWYPSVMNLTSSWDTELIAKVGKAIGEDSLAQGIDIILAPGMNIQKNVLGGRNFEYCSEDPLLTAFAATAYVKGVQSTGEGACLKHFAGNEQETWRGSASSTVTERALREIYLKQFQLTVANASPISIMSSYNPVNGTYTSINKELLTGILRDEWHFRGLVMSDWGSAGAVEDKVNAQNDLKMPGDADDAEHIIAGLAEGRVDAATLDICCAHILYTITKSPTFRGIKMNTGVDYEAHNRIAEEAAAETFVLLKNDNSTLPLKKGTTVAIFGNGSYQTVYGGDGSGAVSPNETVNIMNGIRNSADITLIEDAYNIFERCAAHSKTNPKFDIAVSAEYAKGCAENSNTAVIVISRKTCEGEDNSPTEGDFLLNERESDMIRNVSEAFHAKGKKVTVLINTGSPIEVCSWRDMVDAIMFIGYPGQEAGNAVAAVLSGKVVPSGKTVITWPKAYSDTPAYDHFPGNSSKAVYYEDIYVGYRYYNTFGVEVAYPFGFGLSYTQFEYSDFGITENADGSFTAAVTVTNTGNTAGREIAQIYVSKPETTLEQPALELCGFAKTGLLQPGKSETLTIEITPDALTSYDTQGSRYIIDRGIYTFSAASSAGSIHAEQNAEVKELRVVYDVENRCAPVKEPEHIKK